jgi:hypothetical protein|tara:strand:- start:274 stop:600 length:327 start_codon:yes stop_codon:yes gene_type:complete
MNNIYEKQGKLGTVVIDAYYHGVNGWTFSYTYPDMESATGVDEVNKIYDQDEVDFKDMHQYIYVPRHTGEYPEPEQYLTGMGNKQRLANPDGKQGLWDGKQTWEVDKY